VVVYGVTSSNFAELPVSRSTCGTLARGEKCTFRVSFKPSGVGTRSATVNVASNASGSPHKMSVSGTGTGSIDSDDDTVDLVEYYHQGFDHYFLTSDADEIANLEEGIFAGWERTGQELKALPKDSLVGSPVCRFFSQAFAPKSSHFYTPDASECASVSGNPNWASEGQVFAIRTPAADGTCAAGTDPVYRLYNNGEGEAPNHRYTADEGVRMQMIEQGWIPEGYGPDGVIMCAPR
jgi:hypothetical protein